MSATNNDVTGIEGYFRWNFRGKPYFSAAGGAPLSDEQFDRIMTILQESRDGEKSGAPAEQWHNPTAGDLPEREDVYEIQIWTYRDHEQIFYSRWADNEFKFLARTKEDAAANTVRSYDAYRQDARTRWRDIIVGSPAVGAVAQP